jgi:hypothetical protein
MDLVVLPVGFGLFGFIEPCSIGSTLIFIIKRGQSRRYDGPGNSRLLRKA